MNRRQFVKSGIFSLFTICLPVPLYEWQIYTMALPRWAYNGDVNAECDFSVGERIDVDLWGYTERYIIRKIVGSAREIYFELAKLTFLPIVAR